MRYVAAYLLATLGGNDSPSKDDIKKILGSVGVSVEDDKLEKVLSELKGKDINEVIEAGKEKLAGIPSGGGMGVASGGAGAAGGSTEAPKEEEKKEEAEEEPEESDDDTFFSIFDLNADPAEEI